MPGADEPVVEQFPPTSGRVLGTIGLLLVAAVVVVSVVDPDNGFSAPVVAGAVLVGVLTWASMLRPRVWVTDRSLVLRGMLDTVRIPLAAVEEVAVQQVLAVRAGERRFTSPAVGRSRRQAVRGSRSGSEQATPAGAAAGAAPTVAYPDFVEERIRRLAADAAAAEGIRRWSDEQAARAADVRREPAWVEIVALVLALVALATTLVL